SLKAKYLQMIGNYKEAYRYSKLSQLLSDSLFSENAKARSYDRVKAERDRIKVEKDTQKKIDLLIMLSLGIAVILMSLTMVFMYRSFKERSRAIGALHQQEFLEQKVDNLIQENEISSLNSLLQGQEKERERIGRELHDSVVSTLSTVKLYIKGAEQQINLVAKDANAKITAANQLIDTAMDEVRSISHNLSQGMLAKLGLKEALHNFATIMKDAEEAEVEVVVHGMDDKGDGQLELMIYRNIQELVGNAMKHGEAKKIEIGVTRVDDLVNVFVQDNGKGFDYEQIKANKTGGIGLHGMARKVTLLGGTFEVDSAPGKGTTILMDIPLNSKEKTS
ncbi:MAG: sensor histidine kinase, partial [Bacteroidota bacterium]